MEVKGDKSGVKDDKLSVESQVSKVNDQWEKTKIKGQGSWGKN